MLLELDLTEPPADAPPADPLGFVRSRRRPTLRGVVEALRDAADDPKVVGLLARVGGRLELARAQELRDAVRAFAGSGKPAVGWAETFGEGGSGTVAVPARHRLRRAVAAAVRRPRPDRRGGRGDLPARDARQGRAGAAARAAARVQERGRPAEPVRVHRRLPGGRLPARRVRAGAGGRRGRRGARPHPGAGARAGRRRAAVGRGRPRRPAWSTGSATATRSTRTSGAGSAPTPGCCSSPATVARPAPARLLGSIRHRSKPVVALVTVAGAHPARAAAGAGRCRPAPAPARTPSAPRLRAAGRDDSVKAVVLRVDSPGGSYVASDVIWREVGQLRRAGKPVVASMGDVAASGGYFVAMGADAIVAQPGTVTGSIGVLGGKVVTAGLLDRLGVGTDAVAEGRQARMFSPRVGFDDEQWRRLEEWLDRVYDDFVGKVADGARADPGAGARAGPRPGVDRRRRARARAGRRAGRAGPGGRAGPRAGRAARRTPSCAAGRSCGPPDRLSPPRSSEDRARRRRCRRGTGGPAGAGSPTSPPGSGCRRTARSPCLPLHLR